MGATIFTGPAITTGIMQYILANVLGTAPLPDPNVDAGPGITYQGDSIPDIRMFLPKDKTQSFNGDVLAALNLSYLQSADQIPIAAAAANIASVAGTTSGTPLVLTTTPAAGIAVNIPIMPFSGLLNGASAATIVPIVLDFGFQWCTTTSGSATVVVNDSTQFITGMPLVIAHAGTASTNQALLTNVLSIVDATHITVTPNLPQASITTPVGTGNIWGIREGQGYPVPMAHYPYLAAGPGLFLDPSQSIARGVRVVGVASGTGGNMDVTGYDIYWQPMTERIAVGAGAVTTWGKKAFKAISAITPRFTDAHAYTVGTSDVFGMHFRSDKWEYSNIFWNGAFMTSSTGWTASDKTNPALNTSGDVRGTVQTSANGGGTGIGATVSSGSVTGTALSGVRLAIFQSMPLLNMIMGTPAIPLTMYGATQSPT